MNSPICITPSRPRLVGRSLPASGFPRPVAGPARAGLALAALLLAACAGDRPEPARPADPALPATQAANEPEKGQGNLSFHYANKSTDANLAIDLSSTDVYLEMTGKAAQEQVDQLRAQEGKPEPRKAGPSGRKPAPSGEEAKAPEPKGDDDADEAAEAKGEKASPPGAQAAKGLHKGPPKKPEPPPEENPADFEDVTSKVLAGIRRAQELFYQKRYPEALQAARSSLDARPTAEGYALLGSIYFMQGNTGMARRQWMEALRLNPDMPAVVNMLDKTRTPGGRGSPAPRPVYHPPARAAEPDAPYPEEYSAPASQAPASEAAPAPSAPAASIPAVSTPAAPPAPGHAAAPPAAPAPNESAPSAAAPQPEDDGDEDAASAPTAPAQTAPAAAKAQAPAAPEKPGTKATAAAPKASPKAPASAQPARGGTR